MLTAERNRNRHRRRAVDRPFHRRSDRPRVIDVLAQVATGIDPGNDDIRLFFQQRVERQDHRIGRRALHGVFPFRNLLQIDRLP